MNTVTITDDKPQTMIRWVGEKSSPTPVAVCRVRCTCEWEDKTYTDGVFHFCIDHFIAKHGGNGKLTYKGQYRTVENGFLQPETHSIH